MIDMYRSFDMGSCVVFGPVGIDDYQVFFILEEIFKFGSSDNVNLGGKNGSGLAACYWAESIRADATKC